MKREPSIRRDGRCYVCRKLITTNTRYGDADAFCSATCCRDYYGTSLSPPVQGRPVAASS